MKFVAKCAQALMLLFVLGNNTNAETPREAAADSIARLNSAETISKFESGDVSIYLYIFGIKSGLENANVGLMNSPVGKLSSTLPLYCQPLYLAMTITQAVEITKGYIEVYPNRASSDFPMVFRDAMINAFPCIQNPLK